MAVSSVDTRESINPSTSQLQGLRVAWSGVWSGFLIAIGVFLLLSILGLAIGISSVDVGPGENTSARGLGIGAAVWSGVTLLIALYIGGMVATRTGMVYDRAAGVVEGALIWVLSILALVYMAGSGIGMLSSGVFSALGGAARGAASAAGSVDVSDLTSGDVTQITARLRDPATVRLVASTTGVPEAEARATLSGIAQRVEAVRNDPAAATAEARRGLQELASKAGARVERAAAAAQPYASTTLWTTLLAMVLSLLASIFGAMTGGKQAAQRLGAGTAATAGTTYRSETRRAT